MGFQGKWHIYEMEIVEDEDYFNMEVQAYIEIGSNRGNFQFGLVFGEMDGKIVAYPDGKRFEFTWEGNDELRSRSWQRMG